MRPTHSIAYRPDIDGFRALAVMAVIIHHAYPAAFRTGYIGVDIFFVISGYLISLIILREMDEGKFTISRFYARRVMRIFPALILVMLATFTTGWFLLFGAEFAQLGKHIAGGAGFIANLVLLSESGYFDTASESKPLLHLWSLGVEEQFYIAWPLLLWWTHRRHKRYLGVTLSIMLLSMLHNLYLLKTHQDSQDFYSPLSRFWELMSGGILAYISAHYAAHHRIWHAEWLSLLGFGAILTGLVVLKGHHAYPGYRALLPVMGTCLLIAGGPGTWINRHIFANRPMVWMGLISYPLYLWHWPLLVLLRISEANQASAWQKAGALLLALLLASLTYYGIERPLQRQTASCKTVVTRILAMGLMPALLLLGLVTFSQQGFPEREANRIALLFEQDNANPLLENMPAEAVSCRKILGPLDIEPGDSNCWSNTATPEILLLGDSHASAFFRAAWTGQTSFSAMLYREAGCLPLSNTTSAPEGSGKNRKECGQLGNNAIQIARKLPSLRTVILVSRGTFYVEGTDFSAAGRLPGIPLHDPMDGRRLLDDEADRAYVEGYHQLIQSFMDLGKRVILVSEWPELNFDPASCLQRQLWLTHMAHSCTLPRDVVDQRQAHYWTLLESIRRANPGLEIFDSRPTFCDRHTCSARAGERILYVDDDHINIAGSDLLLRSFIHWTQTPPRPLDAKE